jgi:hypothetical protein
VGPNLYIWQLRNYETGRKQAEFRTAIHLLWLGIANHTLAARATDTISKVTRLERGRWSKHANCPIQLN